MIKTSPGGGCIRAYIPFKANGAKSRLSKILNRKERQMLASLMLEDVLISLKSSRLDAITLLSTSSDGITEIVKSHGIKCRIDDRDLNTAINSILKEDTDPVMIVMSDLPLLKSSEIDRILEFEEDIVIAPGLGGGTNILLVRSPKSFHVDYHGNSLQDHLNIAKESGLSVRIYHSFLAAVDIDEATDLVELLIHSDGRASSYIRSLGFYLVENDGRVTVKREVENA
ncbi:MAG: 2-phospho-L-lactate guanylyltransferase [Candidatus Syntropharchaeales archaeon]